MIRPRLFIRILTVAAISCVSIPAPAQQAPATPLKETPDLQEIVVTGSRIAAPNLKSSSPILALSAADVKITGKTDISDMINQLPQIFNNDLGQVNVF